MQKNTAATTTEAARVVASNALANRRYNRDVPPISAEQAAAEAKRDSESLFGEKPDTTTPLVRKAPLDTLPDPPKAPAPAPEPAKPAKSIALATTITCRDYEITVTATGFTLDAFCDLLDKRLGVVNE